VVIKIKWLFMYFLKKIHKFTVKFIFMANLFLYFFSSTKYYYVFIASVYFIWWHEPNTQWKNKTEPPLKLCSSECCNIWRSRIGMTSLQYKCRGRPSSQVPNLWLRKRLIKLTKLSKSAWMCIQHAKQGRGA